MPSLFWTGKRSLPMKLLVNASNILAWLNGNARDASAMKQRVNRQSVNVNRLTSFSILKSAEPRRNLFSDCAAEILSVTL